LERQDISITSHAFLGVVRAGIQLLILAAVLPACLAVLLLIAALTVGNVAEIRSVIELIPVPAILAHHHWAVALLVPVDVRAARVIRFIRAVGVAIPMPVSTPALIAAEVVVAPIPSMFPTLSILAVLASVLPSVLL
jgi:hypothetical protein